MTCFPISKENIDPAAQITVAKPEPRNSWRISSTYDGMQLSHRLTCIRTLSLEHRKMFNDAIHS